MMMMDSHEFDDASQHVLQWIVNLRPSISNFAECSPRLCVVSSTRPQDAPCWQ